MEKNNNTKNHPRNNQPTDANFYALLFAIFKKGAADDKNIVDLAIKEYRL